MIKERDAAVTSLLQKTILQHSASNVSSYTSNYKASKIVRKRFFHMYMRSKSVKYVFEWRVQKSGLWIKGPPITNLLSSQVERLGNNLQRHKRSRENKISHLQQAVSHFSPERDRRISLFGRLFLRCTHVQFLPIVDLHWHFLMHTHSRRTGHLNVAGRRRRLTAAPRQRSNSHCSRGQVA